MQVVVGGAGVLVVVDGGGNKHKIVLGSSVKIL